MSRVQRRNRDNESNPIVAVGAAALCIGFVVFIFVYDDLKSSPFVQGITGILVTLAIAIILFSAVPNSRARIPIGLVGAAAFYFLILPQVKPFIFPFSSFTGYLAYESNHQPNKGFDPVEGADVEIKGTGLKAKTDATGKFTISDVPSQITVTELIANYGGKLYIINIKDYPDKIYRIPREPDPVRSTIHDIPSNEWVEYRSNTCLSDDQKKPTNVKQFSLRRNVQLEAGYPDLYVEVLSKEEAEIVTARMVEPQGVDKVQPSGDYARSQKWVIPVSGDNVTVHLSLCVGAIKKNVPLSNASLKAQYWFEKVE